MLTPRDYFRMVGKREGIVGRALPGGFVRGV
jgi:hypothetical protein